MDVVVVRLERLEGGRDVAYSMESVVRVQQAFAELAYAAKDVANPVVAVM